MQNYSHVFEGITDRRRRNATRHNLHEMLMIALWTIITGGETCTDMAQYGQEKEGFLRGFMTLKRGIPRHDTFSDLFNCLTPPMYFAKLVISHNKPSRKPGFLSN